MNSRLWMVLLLVIMAVICSSILSFVNIKTAPIIEKNQKIKNMSTVLDVFGVPYNKHNSDEILTIYNKSIIESKEQGLIIFTEKQSGATAVSFSGSGFQGFISLVVALDGETIRGFKVVNQNETPGLGARITEEEFQNSFIGKKISDGITMTKSGNAGQHEFDAITGATETSRSLERILNRGFKQYLKVVRNKG